jgi:hypothetical protein
MSFVGGEGRVDAQKGIYVKYRLSVILEVDVSSRLGLGARLRRIADVGHTGSPPQGHRRG